MIKQNACGKGACYADYCFEILGVVLIILGTILTLMTHSHAGIVMLFIAGIMLCFHKCCLHRKKDMCSGCGCQSDECCCGNANPNPMGVGSESLGLKPNRKPKKDIL